MTASPTSALQETLELLNQALEERSHAKVKDTSLVIQVVGPFSAGKSRLLRELLKGEVPPELLPISSLGAETWLPLAITFGPTPTLCVAQRQQDEEGPVCFVELEQLERFPDREELQRAGWAPEDHRLQLTLPRAELLIHAAEQFFIVESSRIWLVDTLGWDAEGEQTPSLKDLTPGMERLAQVFVLPARMVYHQPTLEAAAALVEEALRQAADFEISATLAVYITRSESKERAQLERTLREALQAAADEACERLRREGHTDLPDLHLFVHALELDELDETARAALREQFWAEITVELRRLATQASAQELHTSCSLAELWEQGGGTSFKPALASLCSSLREQLAALKLLSSLATSLPQLHHVNFKGLDEGQRSERIKKEHQLMFDKAGVHGSLSLAFSPDVLASPSNDSPFHPWWSQLIKDLMKSAAILSELQSEIPVVYLKHSLKPKPRDCVLGELQPRFTTETAKIESWLRGSLGPLCLNLDLAEASDSDEELLATTLTLASLGELLTP